MDDSARDALGSARGPPAVAQGESKSVHQTDIGGLNRADGDAPGVADYSGAGGVARTSAMWGSAKTVLHGVKASKKFQTLRDLIGTDAYIEESRLKMMKALGEGAFAKVQQAELLPPSEPATPSASGGQAVPHGRSFDGQHRIVAVKILRQELLEDKEQVQLFVKEVALLRKLRHEHIVQFVGCSWQRGIAEESSVKGGTPTLLYYVQEYCAGGSLGDLVRRQMIQPFKKLYSDADALRWSLHIARALQYLHEARPVVIHRDLKLENVMVSSEVPGEADAKLGDFGLARLTLPADKEKLQRVTRLLSQPKEAWSSNTRISSKQLDKMLERILTSTTEHSHRTTNLSSPGSTYSTNWAEVSTRELTGKTGSFGYMSPEVSRNQQYNAQADIFSLAMCMYNLFNRTIPTVQILLNGDESQLELYAAKVAEGYRPPMLTTVPPSVKQAIEACWKGSPELRPTAAEVVEMLEKIQETGEIQAAPAVRAPGGCGCTVM